MPLPSRPHVFVSSAKDRTLRAWHYDEETGRVEEQRGEGYPGEPCETQGSRFV